MFPAIHQKLYPVLGLVLLLAACQLGDKAASPTTVMHQPTPVQEPSRNPYSLTGFSDLIEEALELYPRQRQNLVNRYTALLEIAPIINGTRVLFLWRGEAHSIQLAGDMNNWIPDQASSLSRLEGTDLWYLESEFELNARLDYKFVIDHQHWRLDPLNPRTIMSGSGPNSELIMPEYRSPAESSPSNTDIPAGKLSSHSIDSVFLNQTRTFLVYVPAGQLVGKKLPSVYIQDGDEYLSLAGATTLLDRLIARRDIPPLIVVFIPPIDRNSEYLPNDGYVEFLAEELVPWIQETYSSDPAPTATGTLGASLGGLISVYASLTRPDIFGRAAAQSGAFSFGEDILKARLTREQGSLESGGIINQLPKMYMVVGTYETSLNGDDEQGNLLDANRRLNNLLQAYGYQIEYEERSEGHSWGLWKGTLGQALRYLFN